MTTADVTNLLIAYREGDPAAHEALLPMIYTELRRIARRQRALQRSSETLNTTALVHEAYLKLVDVKHLEINDRNHFFAIAARAMRQIIIDYARERTAKKRGGGAVRVSLDHAELSVAGQAETLIAIDAALVKLSEFNERLTRVFECRFFVGLSEQETSAVLALPLRTVQRDWMKSKTWLRQELAPQ